MPVVATAIEASGGATMLCAWSIDRVVGEPPVEFHPVALFGSAMNAVETRIHADTRRAGLGYASVGVVLAVGSAAVARRVLGPAPAAVLMGTIAIAGRMLEDESTHVADLLTDDDLAGARDRVVSLVGRSTDELDEHEIARAVIESLAENTVDAVTATLWWGTVGGAVGASVHRAVNTMDAMVGHRSDRYRNFGWATARLDDVLNWLPARLTVLATMIASPVRCGEIWRVVRRDAHKHPSPNGGVIEAAFAATLGIGLGGVNRYDGIVEDRGSLGAGPPPNSADIGRAIALSRRVGWIIAVGCALGSLATHREVRGVIRSRGAAR